MSKNVPQTQPSLPWLDVAPDRLLENLSRYQAHAQGAFAANTERARRADWRVFMDWCAQRTLTPLPAKPETVATFIDDMSELKAPATVRRCVSTVATAHQAAQASNPCATHVVKLALQRVARTCPNRQKQAAPLNWSHIEEALPKLGSQLRDVRDKALVLVAYDTLCRRSELARLRVQDLVTQPDGSGTILVHTSKTDQTGEGTQKWLAPTTVIHLTAWLEVAGIREGLLFRGVYKSEQLGTSLSAEGVHRALKRIAKILNLHPDDFSGHSCRVGATQDMAAAGIDLPAMMQAGGWKSPRMPARYAEHLLAGRSGMAALAKKQGR